MRRRRGTLFIGPDDSLAAALETSARNVALAPGTYEVGSALIIPDHVTLKGAGPDKTHVKGRIEFGSGQAFLNLKLGAAGYSVRNRAGARDTVFDNCRLRGGGGTDVPVLLLGDGSRSCANLYFGYVEVECNLGSWNNISIRENAWEGGAHIEDVTFDYCHIGVSNGVRDGSPRAGLEAYTHYSTVNTHGWRNIQLRDSEWEAADAFTIDLPDTWRIGDGSVRGGPAFVTGNLIKGGGRGGSYGYSLCVESPEGVEVVGNTIWRSSNNTIATAPDTVNRRPPVFRDNIIDLSVENGIQRRASAIYLRGIGPQFVNNTLISDGDSHALFKVENTDGVVVTGNVVTTHGSPVWKLWDATVRNATLAPNLIDGVER